MGTPLPAPIDGVAPAMQPSARDVYLETQVLTAPPQKLRLMLIEGAIRFVKQTDELWSAERYDEALESLIRAREIIGELMSSLSPEKSPLARQILPLYVFVFRTLTEAQLEKSRQKLADALRVLDEERETWRQVCEKLAGETDLAPPPVEEITAASITADKTPAPAPAAAAPLSFDSSKLDGGAPASPIAAPRPPAFGNSYALPSQGLSFEA